MSSDHWSSVRKRPRKDGTICYSALYWLDGEQTSLPFDDPAAAELFKQSVKVHGAARALEMHGIKPAPRDNTALTVAQWVRRYIDQLTGVEQYTLDVYERYLKNDIVPTLGDIPLTQLTEEDVAQWVKRMETIPSSKTGRVVKPKTIANKHGFLSGALNAAALRNPPLIPANPAAGRRLPRTTGVYTDDVEDDDEIRMLSHAEYDRLHAEIIDHYKKMVEFKVTTGYRWGEISALKPSDVNREERSVKVLRAWKHSSRGYHIGPPKTKKSKRTTYLSSGILDELDYSHEWLFTNLHGGPVRYPAFRRMWDRAVVKAGLEDRPTPHCLRHTCGSWLLAEGVPLIDVSEYLGHENVSITARIYAHADRDSKRAVADVMGRLLSR